MGMQACLHWIAWACMGLHGHAKACKPVCMGVSVCHGHGLPGQGQPSYPSALLELLFCLKKMLELKKASIPIWDLSSLNQQSLIPDPLR
jgi:hypothetical protein